MSVINFFKNLDVKGEEGRVEIDERVSFLKKKLASV